MGGEQRKGVATQHREAMGGREIESVRWQSVEICKQKQEYSGEKKAQPTK
jgi:hypothetical protein